MNPSVDGDKLHDQIRRTALHLTTRISAHTHSVARHLGLGSTDCKFLALLVLHGPLTPGQLGTSAGLTSGAVTGAIDRLERAGFVCRRRETADRRSRLVVPLPAAIARITAEYEHWINLLGATLRRHDPTELAIIADFFADLSDHNGRTVDQE